MISIFLNGEQRNIQPDTRLGNAMTAWGYTGACFAVAINETFVARSHYEQTQLNEGDRIDIVSPMQGG